MKTNLTKTYFKYNEDGSIQAVIVNTETKEEIANRTVKVRHGDTPDKVVGRTYAFKKLMNYIRENHLLPNEEFQNIWKEFGKIKQPSQKLDY